MFGYVNASLRELTDEQRKRYNAVYCGICRNIRSVAGQAARLSLSYDMTFLAMLLMSLYEPEETSGPNACKLHPIEKRPWVDSDIIRYTADMNVLLAFYKCRDDYMDDHSRRALMMGRRLRPSVDKIRSRWYRQERAIRINLQELTRLEQANCADIDEMANTFGHLLGELFVYEHDLWGLWLRELGRSLGRFIYLADAALDYEKDKKKGKYNPYIAAGIDDPAVWEEHLVLAMGRCTHYFEMLPLVQDKPILDNILYSGVWLKFPKRKNTKEVTE